jgi:hypothetical protein
MHIYRTSMEQGMLAPPTFLNHFRKQWPKGFSELHEPQDDRPWVEETIAAVQSTDDEPYADDAQLFFLAYDDGQASLDVHIAIHYLQRANSSNLCDQIHSKKKGTAWMDDRCYEHTAAQELAVPCVPPGGQNLLSTVRTASPDAADVEHTTSEGPPCTTDFSQGPPSVLSVI